MTINFFDEQYFNTDEIWEMVSFLISNTRDITRYVKCEFSCFCDGIPFLVGVGNSDSVFAKVGKYIGTLNGKDFYSAFIKATESTLESFEKGTFSLEAYICGFLPKNDFEKMLNCLRPGKPGNPDWAQRHRFMCD